MSFLMSLFYFIFIILYIFKNLFIWLHWVFVPMRGLSLVVASRGYSSCGTWASHCSGFSCCGAWALGTRAQQLWLTGLVALWHVGSSRTRAQIHVPCIGRRFLTAAPPGSPSLFYLLQQNCLMANQLCRKKACSKDVHSENTRHSFHLSTPGYWISVMLLRLHFPPPSQRAGKAEGRFFRYFAVKYLQVDTPVFLII